MTTSSHDLQATHQILTLLENSKERVDEILDHLKGIFAIIDSEGQIYKCNLKLAQHFGCDAENAITQNFFSLFRKETANQFSAYLGHVGPRSNSEEDLIQFELNLNNASFAEEKVFYWEVTQFGTFKTSAKILYTIVGRDITELRRTERQLSEIFSNIPIGIMTISEEGLINEQYSIYLEWLFGRKNLSNQNIREILLQPCWDLITENDRKGFQALVESLGQPEFVFDSSKTSFPKQIFYPSITIGNSAGGLHLSLTYHPFVYDGIVKRLLIIVENITEIVSLKESEKREVQAHDRIAKRVLELKNSQVEILSLCMNEINGLFLRLKNEVQEIKDFNAVKSTLHGIKGSSRIAGLKTLATMAHKIESELVDMTLENIPLLQILITELADEWKEIYDLYLGLYFGKENNDGAQTSTKVKQIKELFDRYRNMLLSETTYQRMIMVERLSLALTNLNSVALDPIFPMLELNVSKNAEALGKQVKIKIDSQNEQIDEEIRSTLLECLNHILNNSLAHGIETPADRYIVGKSIWGNINIIFSQDLGRLKCKIIDDGAGLNIDKIRRILVKKRLISYIEAQNLNEQQVIQWIFKSDFSTSENIDDISGRGVGLSAVVDALKSVNGSIVAYNNHQASGACFEISLRSYKDIPYERRAMSASSLMDKLVDQMILLAENKYYISETTDIVRKDLNGVVLCDPLKLILAVTTIIAHFSASNHVSIEFSFNHFEGYIGLKIKKIQTALNTTPLEVEYTVVQESCQEYLSGHSGKIQLSEDNTELEIQFGVLLDHNELPTFTLVKPEEMADECFTNIRDHVSESLRQIGLNITVADSTKTGICLDPPELFIYVTDKTITTAKEINLSTNNQEIQQIALCCLEKIFLN